MLSADDDFSFDMKKNRHTYSRECSKKIKLAIQDRESHQEIVHIDICTPTKTNHKSSLNNTMNDTRSQLLEIDQKSLSSLEPGKMLNDTVIEFYMNYVLNNKILPERREKTHLFSTFFFNKLKNLAKSNETVRNQSIRRWDRHVNLFEKDYLVVPICDSHHWLLVIIVRARQAPAHDDPVVISDMSRNRSNDRRTLKACLLIFDSLGYKYMTKFTEPIRKFLDSRWQYERPNEERRNFGDRNSFKDVFAKVPRQRNLYDCGIYLLHSFEKFFDEPGPVINFNKIIEGKDLSFDWRVDTKAKRILIKSLITERSSHA